MTRYRVKINDGRYGGKFLIYRADSTVPEDVYDSHAEAMVWARRYAFMDAVFNGGLNVFVA